MADGGPANGYTAVNGLNGKSMTIGSMRVYQRERPALRKLCCPKTQNETELQAPDRHVYRHVHRDACTRVCIDMHIDIHIDTRTDMNIDMGIDICMDICIDMHVDMCIDMWVLAPKTANGKARNFATNKSQVLVTGEGGNAL